MYIVPLFNKSLYDYVSRRYCLYIANGFSALIEETKHGDSKVEESSNSRRVSDRHLSHFSNRKRRFCWEHSYVKQSVEILETFFIFLGSGKINSEFLTLKV